MANVPHTVKTFISYARADLPLLEDLVQALAPLTREGLVELTYDRNLAPGDDYLDRLVEMLDTAELALFLVSNRSLASRPVGVEVEYAMTRRAIGRLTVVPIILERCDWISRPFGGLQALPPGAISVMDAADRSAALASVALGVKETALSLSRPQRDAEYKFFDNAALMEARERVKTSIGVLRLSLAGYVNPDARALIDLQTLEKRLDCYNRELKARLGSF